MLWMNGISDVSGVTFDVRCRSDSKANSSELLTRFMVNHPQMVGRNFVDFLESVLDQFQFELFVAKARERLHRRLDEFKGP